MAYGNPSSGSAYAMNSGGGGGNEDYFADAPESKGEERMTPKSEEEHDQDEYGETAVIPKSLLGGKEFKPGEEMVVQIVSVHGDQVEIKYATDKGEKEEEREGGPPPGEEPEPKGDTEMQGNMY